MRAERFKLYVDENGVSDLAHWDPNFTLCGIIVKKSWAEELGIKSDQIKFKYWGRTDIVFHSKDIAAKSGDFSILSNATIQKDFQRDLLNFLNLPCYQCIIVSVDKPKASAAGWKSANILDRANEKMIEMFLKFLTKAGKSNKGQIVLESSSAQDIAFYKQYAHFISHGLTSISLTPDDVKKTLTSLSFVSKGNHDIEAQLADLLAYPATQKFLHLEGKRAIAAGSHLEKMTNTAWAKRAFLGPGATNETSIRLP